MEYILIVSPEDTIFTAEDSPPQRRLMLWMPFHASQHAEELADPRESQEGDSSHSAEPIQHLHETKSHAQRELTLIVSEMFLVIVNPYDCFLTSVKQ